MDDKKKILIVEDSKLLRSVVQAALMNAGFEVYESENGRDGLEFAKQLHPDLIMLDVVMPIMDGMTMFQLLRQDEWGKTVPVVMLTGTEEERIISWISSEDLDFFKKENWMMDEVVSHVRNKLGIKD